MLVTAERALRGVSRPRGPGATRSWSRASSARRWSWTSMRWPPMPGCGEHVDGAGRRGRAGPGGWPRPTPGPGSTVAGVRRRRHPQPDRVGSADRRCRGGCRSRRGSRPGVRAHQLTYCRRHLAPERLQRRGVVGAEDKPADAVPRRDVGELRDPLRRRSLQQAPVDVPEIPRDVQDPPHPARVSTKAALTFVGPPPGSPRPLRRQGRARALAETNDIPVLARHPTAGSSSGGLVVEAAGHTGAR